MTLEEFAEFSGFTLYPWQRQWLKDVGAGHITAHYVRDRLVAYECKRTRKVFKMPEQKDEGATMTDEQKAALLSDTEKRPDDPTAAAPNPHVDGTSVTALTDEDKPAPLPSLLGTADIMQYFTYEHLPPRLQSTSRQFADLAAFVHDCTPVNAEQSVALRKLLEAKDAAVRAILGGGPVRG